MPRRGWVLSFLAVAVVGGTLAVAPPASAEVSAYLGVRDLVRRADGGYPSGRSDVRTVTPDGRFVLLGSDADGLVADDTNGAIDTYVVDATTRAVERISGTEGGAPSTMTPDGRWVVWGTFGVGWYLTDRSTHTVEALPVPTGGSVAAISDDAGVLLFRTTRPITPEDFSSYQDWYAYDRASGVSLQVDLTPDGGQPLHGASATVLSGDGSTVVFVTDDPAFDPRLGGATYGVVRRRLGAGGNELLAVGTRLVYLHLDTSGDVVAMGSSDGAPTLLHTPAGVVDLHGTPVQMTPDGRFLLLRDPDSQLYQFDVETGARRLVTADEAGAPLGGHLLSSSISAEGRYVAFTSTADGVVGGTPHGAHTYVRDAVRGTTVLVCCALSSPGRTSDLPWVAAGGDRVVFSSSQQLDPDDTDYVQDAFVWDRFGPGFQVGSARGRESSGPIAVPVMLDEPAATTTHFTWRAAGTWPTSDLAATSGTIDIPAGETLGIIGVPVVDDDVHEATERYQLTVTYGTGATASSTITIDDDDPEPAVSVADTHVAEDRGPMAWTLSLDRPSELPVTVHWSALEDTSAPSDGQAAANKDFVPASGTVTFAPGQTTATVSAGVVNDRLLERDERFVVQLSWPTGAALGRTKATGIIDDDEAAFVRLLLLPGILK